MEGGVERGLDDVEKGVERGVARDVGLVGYASSGEESSEGDITHVESIGSNGLLALATEQSPIELERRVEIEEPVSEPPAKRVKL